MFNFELLDENGKVLQIVSNDAEGKIQFKAITYDKAGTYKYKVREVNNNLNGIKYDETVYEVTVTVTDNEEN